MSLRRVSTSIMSRGSSPRALHRSIWKASVALARLDVEHPLQRRVRDDAAVPVVLAVDLGGGKPGGSEPLAMM